jgi:hypothetical protein
VVGVPAGAGRVIDDSSISTFTGAELALADTVILLMKVMSMHGIIDSAAILTVCADLELRYRRQNLHGAAAMADYLRQHAGNTDRETLVRAQAVHGETQRDPA